VPRRHLEDADLLIGQQTQHPSTIFNIILHAVYDLDCSPYSPSFLDVSMAISALPSYGMPLAEHVQPAMPLFKLAMAHAPFIPLQVYGLAGGFRLDGLAKAASSHLLSLQVSSVTDEQAMLVGPVYLSRLIKLHLTRMSKLRALLFVPPVPHLIPRSLVCADEPRHAWSLFSAALAWDIRPGTAISSFRHRRQLTISSAPDLSVAMMRAAMMKPENKLSCSLCRQCIHIRLEEMIEEWLLEKVSFLHLSTRFLVSEPFPVHCLTLVARLGTR
jgi:hypothetical protein